MYLKIIRRKFTVEKFIDGFINGYCKLIGYLKRRGTRQLVGSVLHENLRMLQLARDLGFTVRPVPHGDDAHPVVLDLQGA